MSVDRFQEMQVFVAVAEEESFAAAARRLDTSAASVTRAVAALEARLGIMLLSRTTRRVYVSEAGQRYLDDCRRILAELTEAEESAAGSYAIARGQLTMTAPVLFGELYVTPLMVDYLNEHPQVSIKALMLDRVVNMLDEGVDVAVRIGHLPDSGLYAARVGSVRRVVCAAPAFLERQGRPEHPDQLRDQSAVVIASSPLLARWQFKTDTGPIAFLPPSRLVVTANQAAISAAVAGWGYTCVLSYQVARQVAKGELEIVLHEYELPPLPIHVVYHGGAKISARVRTFVDYCVARLRADPALQYST
ncbi:LysR family transcriptional regulator [Cellvibrio sp. ARAG 10.3]|uniref:LysR family transcriptional regulator n=1 Tax=Cellvibrio sp. ARAG 10.3 TaxID=3451358 RepID=UPI003F47ADD6